MTIRRCAIMGCEQMSAGHRFPNPERDPKRFKVWIHRSGNAYLQSLDPIKVYNGYRVCLNHFVKEHIGPNNRLRNTAILKLNVPVPLGVTDVEASTGPHGLPHQVLRDHNYAATPPSLSAGEDTTTAISKPPTSFASIAEEPSISELTRTKVNPVLKELVADECDTTNLEPSTSYTLFTEELNIPSSNFLDSIKEEPSSHTLITEELDIPSCSFLDSIKEEPSSHMLKNASTQTSGVLSNSSHREMLLRKKVQLLRKEKYRRRLRPPLSPEITEKQFREFCDKNFNKEMAAFIKAQLQLQKRKPKDAQYVSIIAICS